VRGVDVVSRDGAHPLSQPREVARARLRQVRAPLGEHDLDHASRIEGPVHAKFQLQSRGRRKAMTDVGGSKLGLLERLEQGSVICAEGYLFEFERRGYLQAGAFVPEVVLEHPELVSQLHREFVHAGSDVVEAFTYYAHREKLRIVGKEHLLEQMNRQALELAKEVADESGALLAGDICNTNVFLGDDESSNAARAMFEEQVGWAIDAGVDFIIAETFTWGGEALVALDVIKQTGLPAVVTLSVHQEGVTPDGYTPEDICKRLEEAGADVVGLNCGRGPRTMLPLLERIRENVEGHVAGLPVPYRTTEAEPTFQSLRDPEHEHLLPEGRPFPTALDPFVCSRYELSEFARRADALGIRYLGVCCGAGPHHIRGVAEGLGRTPPASRYSADMSKHAYFGTDERLLQENQEYAQKL
jgi:betaine-homocysteine S-methyltransferase